MAHFLLDKLKTSPGDRLIFVNSHEKKSVPYDRCCELRARGTEFISESRRLAYLRLYAKFILSPVYTR